jgi:perosamine synthetase
MNITEPCFDETEISLLREVLNSKWVTQGPKTAEFERLFADRHQVKFAAATTSCTAALHLSALALGLKPGDQVLVPAFTWVTSAHAAEYVGAKPVFVDIDLTTFNIDVGKIEEAITPRTRAIIVVHLFGKSAPMDEITALCERYGISIIEDAACAVGTTYRGRYVGGFGDLGCFSFHPRKVITTGEGGMVTTNNPVLAKKVGYLRNHGATGPAPGIDSSLPYAMSTFNELGFNLRLSDIQAAVGVAQMGKLQNLLDERRRLALNYSKSLSDITEIIPPVDDPGHTYQSYVVRLADPDRKYRNRIMKQLALAGIQTRPGTHAVHRLGYYSKKYGPIKGHFPHAEEAEDNSITLPIFPGMKEVQQEEVLARITLCFT